MNMNFNECRPLSYDHSTLKCFMKQAVVENMTVALWMFYLKIQNTFVFYVFCNFVLFF